MKLILQWYHGKQKQGKDMGQWIPRPVLTAEAASLSSPWDMRKNQDCSTGLIPMELTGKREPQNLWRARRLFHCGEKGEDSGLTGYS